MLRQLAISDVVLVERLELEFEPGLGVLTGETGAGKSILLDALGLALGARSDAGLVRTGQSGASVSAAFELPDDHAAHALLAEQGIETEPGEPLLLRRTLKADGGSRAFVGAAAVPASVLRDIGAAAIEVHGQQDDRGLLNPRGHRALLDSFGRIDVAPIQAAWADVVRLQSELEAARAAAEAGAAERAWLEHAAGEIQLLDPQPGEESRLAEERSAIQKAAKAGEALVGLDELLGGSDGALALLRQAARRIERNAADHPLLADALAALDRAVIEAAEAEDRIARAAESFGSDPLQLERAEARLFDIRALARKHRVEPDALADLAAQLAEQLRSVEQSGERVAQLEQALAGARATFDTHAAALRRARAAAAERLDAAVMAELEPLRLGAARFRTALGDAPPGPSGIDRVEFEISTNPGAPFGPLTRIASGGELSRFILALKVALAETGSAGTMIFDEIDRGVGGAVASAIGERLARLAEGAQVLVVTHSPQVAARAAHHYRIEKVQDGAGARTTVRRLHGAERHEEIARMLSGAAVTDEARAQAARLLEAA
jgi:DNA repair protein RecN (Recombination protein N)